MAENDDQKAGLVHVGKLVKAPTRKQLRLSESAATIRLEPPRDIDFQHTVLCQTALPYSEIKERVWKRQNGDVYIEVDAGSTIDPTTNKRIDLPLPYGPKARLILIHLCTEAIRHKSPLVEVGDSLTEFFRKLLDRTPNGREMKAFRGQLAALGACRFQMATVVDGRTLNLNTTVIEKYDLVREVNYDERQRALWPNTVELSPTFYRSLVNQAVPLDHRAIAALASSAMALDIYVWLAQRLWRIKNGPILIAWSRLHEQFGQGYAELRFFRREFLSQLADVVEQYPGAAGAVTPNEQGLLLREAATPVPPRSIAGGA